MPSSSSPRTRLKHEAGCNQLLSPTPGWSPRSACAPCPPSSADPADPFFGSATAAFRCILFIRPSLFVASTRGNKRAWLPYTCSVAHAHFEISPGQKTTAPQQFHQLTEALAPCLVRASQAPCHQMSPNVTNGRAVDQMTRPSPPLPQRRLTRYDGTRRFG